mmetsp:Transcript_27994/g.52116  ORF Transcript_27994/g.52116 Transcript_27994/m.52116 type:complete len:225 (-) Transcript_27994:198-872(-)
MLPSRATGMNTNASLCPTLRLSRLALLVLSVFAYVQVSESTPQNLAFVAGSRRGGGRLHGNSDNDGFLTPVMASPCGEPSSSTSADAISNSESRNDTRDAVRARKKRLYPFSEARKIARGHGFQSREEFVEYECAGAYQLPKNPDVVWKDEWKGWDDFLGAILPFDEGREVARRDLDGVRSAEEYQALMRGKSISDDELASRLPIRPELYYKNEWISWDDWLGL